MGGQSEGGLVRVPAAKQELTTLYRIFCGPPTRRAAFVKLGLYRRTRVPQEAPTAAWPGLSWICSIGALPLLRFWALEDEKVPCAPTSDLAGMPYVIVISNFSYRPHGDEFPPVIATLIQQSLKVLW